MPLTMEEIKDTLIARCDPDTLISILEPDIDELVEACHELIFLNEAKVLKYIEDTDL